MTPRAFTLVELLVVVASIGILLGLATHAYRRAKWTAYVTSERARLRGKLDEAVARGAIRTQPKFDEALRHIEWQIQTGLKQGQ